MLRVNHAILHVCDFESCVNVFSEDELDLTNKNVKSYVMRIARHALGGMDNRRGEFFPDSLTAPLDILFVYVGKKPEPYAKVEEAMRRLLKKIFAGANAL